MRHTDITAEPEDSDGSIRKAVAGKLNSIPLRYHRKKDGTVFPVKISVSVFVHKGKKVLCGIVRDITERKKAEEQIKASLREKEILIQEIYHRTRNNMSVILLFAQYAVKNYQR